MSRGFVQLLIRFKDLLERNLRDIHSLKEHSRVLTEQFHQPERSISSLPEESTIVVPIHPIRLQVNHHPQSPFKPIKQQFH